MMFLILILCTAALFPRTDADDLEVFREEWEYEFIKSVKRQYSSYYEGRSLIIKSKLYPWTEEDKVNLCYNLDREMGEAPAQRLFRFKEKQQPSMIEKPFGIQTRGLSKQLKDIFWFVECVRCPIKNNTFYVIESVNKNCYFTLTTTIPIRSALYHIHDEICVTALNSAV